MPEKYTPSDNRLLIPRLGTYINDAQEFIDRTESVFRTGSVRHVADAILILASQSVVFTTEEIMSFFHGSKKTVDYAISMLKKGRYPFIETKYFASKQGQSKKYFNLTAAGLREAERILNGHYYNIRAKGASPSKAVHTYGTGMNIYQAFFAGFPFRTKREVSPKGQKFNELNGLFTDVVIYAYPEEVGKAAKIFVEEDTGSESRNILIEKLRKYDSSGCVDGKNDVVLFSFFVPSKGGHLYKNRGSNGLDALIFNEGDLIRLSEDVRSSGFDDAFSYYDSLPEKPQVVEDFLISVDGAKKADGGLVRGSISVTGDFIDSYLSTRKSFQNPYVTSGINGIHQKFSNDNLRMFAENFALLSGSGEHFLRLILFGCQIFCCATPLSCDAMRFALFNKDSNLQQIVKTTLGYGAELTYDGGLYRFKKEERLSPVLRNVFMRDGLPVSAFEMSCFDAGSWYRIWYAIKGDYELSFPIVCMFYDLKQAEQFFRYLGRYDYASGKIKIAGVLYRELGRNKRLFYPCYNKDTDSYEFFVLE